jgi:hypothetical protein
MNLRPRATKDAKMQIRTLLIAAIGIVAAYWAWTKITKADEVYSQDLVRIQMAADYFKSYATSSVSGYTLTLTINPKDKAANLARTLCFQTFHANHSIFRGEDMRLVRDWYLDVRLADGSLAARCRMIDRVGYGSPGYSQHNMPELPQK